MKKSENSQIAARHTGSCAHLLAWLGALVVSACGGGGVGGSEDLATITVETPASVSSTTYEGQSVDSVVLHLKVTSRAETLAGKTLYVFYSLADDQLFQDMPFVSIDTGSNGQPVAGGVVQLIGVTSAPAGARIYSGTISVKACLDAQCNQSLPVANGNIPYRIEVKPGLVLGADEVRLSAEFGVVPTAVDVPVQLPADLKKWYVEAREGTSLQGFDAQPKDGAAGASLHVSARSLYQPNTTNEEDAFVVATTTSGHTFRRNLHLVQETGRAGQLSFAFQRPTAEFNVSLGTEFLSEPVYASAMFPGKNGEHFHYLGTSYEWPSAANANLVRNRWLYAYRPDETSTTRDEGQDSYFIELKVQPCYDGTCLPVGTYRAIAHYRFSPPGADPQDIDHVTTMNVTR